MNLALIHPASANRRPRRGEGIGHEGVDADAGDEAAGEAVRRAKSSRWMALLDAGA
jgi:hypothetical protein